jgi:ABC-2 type transport system ATP-binding protein
MASAAERRRTAPVQNPLFGIVISDRMQRPVFAATTGWRQSQTGSFAAGERAEVRLRFENLLAAGRYSVSPEVAHQAAERRLMDHRENAATLVVTGGREGAGIADLPHEFAVERPEGVAAKGQVL